MNNNYPQNRIYVLSPVKFKNEIAGSMDFSFRKDKYNIEFFWDFDVNDPKLKKLMKNKELKFFTHKQVLQEISKEKFIINEVSVGNL